MNIRLEPYGEEHVKFIINDEGVDLSFDMDTQTLVRLIVNMFFDKERKKIAPLRDTKNMQWSTVASKADATAKEKFVGCFISGFGFKHEWLDAIDTYIKHCGDKGLVEYKNRYK